MALEVLVTAEGALTVLAIGRVALVSHSVQMAARMAVIKERFRTVTSNVTNFTVAALEGNKRRCGSSGTSAISQPTILFSAAKSDARADSGGRRR